MISILIPTFNDDCRGLAGSLMIQAEAIDGLEWEIIIADDASTNTALVESLSQLNKLEGFRYIRCNTNLGRSAIRNFLAQEARGEWLLFVDAHRVMVSNDYLKTYISATQNAQVICGGYQALKGPDGNLRYLYEHEAERNNSASLRAKHPYQSFNASNFMIRRDIFMQHQFDTRLHKYGYEDVLLGRELALAGIPVTHIDAPTGYIEYECNANFVEKAEEAMETLHQFRDSLQGYSPILTVANRLQGNLAGAVFCKLFQWKRNAWRNNLTSRRPSLLIFKLYKLGYYMACR